MNITFLIQTTPIFQNEIKNTLLETKNKQFNRSVSSMTVSYTENSSSTFPDSILTETANTPVVVASSLPPPPPPPPIPADIFSKKPGQLTKPTSLNLKRLSAEAPEKTLRAKSGTVMRNSVSSSSFMEELHRKLRSSEAVLKQSTNDANNNVQASENLNAANRSVGGNGERDVKQLTIQRLEQASEVPEWKRRLIEKRRMSRTDLGSGW